MSNIIKAQLIENGRIIQEEIAENFLSGQAKLNSEFLYRKSLCQTSESTGSPPNSPQLDYSEFCLWDNTPNFDANNMYWDAAPGLVGYCDHFSQSIAGDLRMGAYLPSLFVNSGIGTKTYTWEWGTTQGNGTIKSMGFVPSTNNDFSTTVRNIQYAVTTPDLTNCTYIGYKTSGSDKILYFRKYGTGIIANNIIGIKETDMSLYETLSLAVSGGFANQPVTSPASPNLKDVVLCNGFTYTFTSNAQNNDNYLRFKKAPVATGVYGSAQTAIFTIISPYTYNNISAITSDERYIYVLYGYSTSGIYQMMTFDTQTDTVVNVQGLAGTPWANSQSAGSYTFCIDPFNPANIFIANSPGICYQVLKDNIAAGYKSVCSYSSQGTDIMYVKNGTPITHSYDYPNKFMAQYTRNPSVQTYAALSNPITKTSSQSLRIQYTIKTF